MDTGLCCQKLQKKQSQSGFHSCRLLNSSFCCFSSFVQVARKRIRNKPGCSTNRGRSGRDADVSHHRPTPSTGRDDVTNASTQSAPANEYKPNMVHTSTDNPISTEITSCVAMRTPPMPHRATDSPKSPSRHSKHRVYAIEPAASTVPDELKLSDQAKSNGRLAIPLLSIGKGGQSVGSSSLQTLNASQLIAQVQMSDVESKQTTTDSTVSAALPITGKNDANNNQTAVVKSDESSSSNLNCRWTQQDDSRATLHQTWPTPGLESDTNDSRSRPLKSCSDRVAGRDVPSSSAPPHSQQPTRPSSAMAVSAAGSSNRQSTVKQGKTSAVNLAARKERKTAKILAIITGVFIICWLPFFVTVLLMAICPLYVQVSDMLFSILLWLGYVNSLLNPIIYTIFSPDFRNAFKRLLTRCRST